MVQHRWLRIMVLGILSLLVVPMIAHAQTTITFEESTNWTAVGTIDGAVFRKGWLAFKDSDAGGSMNSVANEPSPSTVALLDESLVSSALDTRITFPQPVKTVSFYYSLNTNKGSPVVSFYGVDNTLLGTAAMNVCGVTLCGNMCSGDPNGWFCSWAELTFTSSTSYISYMEFSLTALDGYVIDNLSLDDPLNRNGFWAPPGESGSAIAIDIRGNRLAVGWGAYDKDTGEPSWLYSENKMTDSNHYVGDLYKFGQGQCFGCPYTPPKVQNFVGAITITFQTDTTAEITAFGITQNVEKVD